MIVMNAIAGETVIQALTKAYSVALHERKNVLLEINDIMMLIDKKSSLSGLLNKYRTKLQFKHEIEQLKRVKQK